MKAGHIAFISVGSNLGDKLRQCRAAIDALAGGGEIRITGQSRMYRTEPVDLIDQEWFVNCVIRVATELAPLELLERLQAVQRQAGRPEGGVRFGPRVIDLDILLYDARVLQDPRLTLPHPRMHRRRFVLRPLCDIDPDAVHPVSGRTAAAMLAALDEDGQQVLEIT
jgi:2-amino-4-hydroxy-6-hydroxymethyldihydropteridine diphosphokinase